jgi:prefoldin subunit 1
MSRAQKSGQDVPGAHQCFRFVQSPTSEVQKRLEAEAVELKSDKSNLDKKLHYLETTFKNSQDNLERLLKSGGGA